MVLVGAKGPGLEEGKMMSDQSRVAISEAGLSKSESACSVKRAKLCMPSARIEGEKISKQTTTNLENQTKCLMVILLWLGYQKACGETSPQDRAGLVKANLFVASSGVGSIR